MRRALAALALVPTLAALAGCDDAGAQQHAARLFVFQKLSTSDEPVVVGPAVTQSGYAVVDWTRGGLSGGRALVRRTHDGWAFVLCGGADVKRRPVLERAGVPDGPAGVLVSKLLREESRITPERRSQIERWTGLGTTTVSCPEPQPR